jgi:preprotein translocase subunit SecG
MVNILISIVMVALLVICGLMAVIILMQKPSANAGMGASLGGGAAESVFGGEAGNMLLKYTIRISVAFFVISFLLYMSILWHHRVAAASNVIPLPNFGIASPATAPASLPTAANTTSANTTAAGASAASAPVAPLPALPTASASAK